MGEYITGIITIGLTWRCCSIPPAGGIITGLVCWRDHYSSRVLEGSLQFSCALGIITGLVCSMDHYRSGVL